jgi:hypothetical protein
MYVEQRGKWTVTLGLIDPGLQGVVAFTAIHDVADLHLELLRGVVAGVMAGPADGGRHGILLVLVNRLVSAV